MTECELLREQWRLVANVLIIKFESPFFLDLPSCKKWEFAGLLPQFGGKRGMLIGVEHNSEAFTLAKELGYGITSMLAETHYLPIDATSYIECLKDWGWVSKDLPPKWY